MQALAYDLSQHVPFYTYLIPQMGMAIFEPEAKPPCPEVIKSWNISIAAEWLPANNSNKTNIINNLYDSYLATESGKAVNVLKSKSLRACLAELEW